ncbi:apoptosis-associated speck-like protein containing a CARD isoform X1 [Ranitomeya variabilis]|uniref:apoptosis-associated speck-like protein containing a CARD isoform X1 n=1 Tax=Ranitomeya variabilis TaxID=490064 RepID=UPI00405680BB
MGRTVKDVLIDTLENLERKSFKKFKNKLNDIEIKEGYSKIPKGTLQEADDLDTADLILRYYKDHYGIQVTLTVLEAINENKEAAELKKAIMEVTGFAPQESSMGDQRATSRAPIEEAAQGVTSREEEHFVDRHRAQLIALVALVDPILDDLLQWKLLTSQDYITVRSMNTPQNKMRQLFCYVVSWGERDKDQFLKSLREHNAPLIRNLEGK